MTREQLEQAMRLLAANALERSAAHLAKNNDIGAQRYSAHAATLLAAIEPIHLLAPEHLAVGV